MRDVQVDELLKLNPSWTALLRTLWVVSIPPMRAHIEKCFPLKDVTDKQSHVFNAKFMETYKNER